MTTTTKRIDRLEVRNKLIRDEYQRLRNFKQLGKRKYNHGYIIAQLQEKYFLSVKTIERIIWS